MYLFPKVHLHIFCSIDTKDHDLVLDNMHATANINIRDIRGKHPSLATT